MNDENKGSLDTLVQEKIDSDNDFQESLSELSDEEKEQAISDKKVEISEQIFSDLSESSKKNEEVAKNYKIRAEKAESKISKKEGGGETPKTPEGEETPKKSKEDSDISPRDAIAFMNAKITNEEDIEDVIKAAKLLDKTISEALEDETVKAILGKKEEHRKTANAANISAGRPTSKKVSDSELLSRLSKGEVPEKGSEEANRVYWAKRGGKRE